MKGFRDFLMRGNLVELAVAVIMGTAFAAVVKAFTGMIMDLIGKVGGKADFSKRVDRRHQRRRLHHRPAELRADRRGRLLAASSSPTTGSAPG